MPRREFSKTRPLAAATLMVAGVLPASMIGCASFAPPPSVTSAAYDGPPVSVGASGANHIAVVEAPTPGWTITLDRVLTGPGRDEAYITMRRPFPGVIYAPVVVTQRVATAVPVSRPIHIYARLVEHDERPAASDEYALAAQSPGQPK